MKKALPIILIVAGLAAVFVKFSFLPQIGNPDDPAMSEHLIITLSTV